MSMTDIGWMSSAFLCGAVFWWVLMVLHGCPKQHVLPGEREIKTLSLRYGDYLVFKFSRKLSRDMREDLIKDLRRIIPAFVKVIILDEDFSLEAVLRNGVFDPGEEKIQVADQENK